MPLEELRNYQGRNPRPDDFDAYWQAGLSEMRAVDSNVELVKAGFESPGAECFDLYFTGVRGSRIYAQYIRPADSSGSNPAVIQFHGYSGNSGGWSDKLKWVAAGFSVAAMDCRGQGGKSQDTGCVKGTTHRGHIVRGLADSPDDMLFRHIFLDAAQLAGIVMDFPEVDADRVGVLGSSQGGGISLACAALENRIKRAAPAVAFLCDYKRVWEMDLALEAYEELRLYLRNFDPTHTNVESMWKRLGYIDCQHLAGWIKADVLMGVGLMDTVCPPSSQFAAYNKIQSLKEIVIYPDFAHENLAGFNDKVFRFMLAL